MSKKKEALKIDMNRIFFRSFFSSCSEEEKSFTAKIKISNPTQNGANTKSGTWNNRRCANASICVTVKITDLNSTS